MYPKTGSHNLEPMSKDEQQEENQVQQQLQEEPNPENELEMDTQGKSPEQEGQNELEMANANGDENAVTGDVKTEDESNEDQLAESATDNAGVLIPFSCT